MITLRRDVKGCRVPDRILGFLVAGERKGLAVLLEILASGHHVIKG